MSATEDDVYFVELVPGPTEQVQPESTVTMRSFYLEASTETQAGQELRDWPIQFFLANYAAAAKVGDPDYSVVLNANPEYIRTRFAIASYSRCGSRLRVRTGLHDGRLQRSRTSIPRNWLEAVDAGGLSVTKVRKPRAAGLSPSRPRATAPLALEWIPD